MELKSKKLISIMAIAGLFMLASIMLTGCEESDEGATEPAAMEMDHNMAEHEAVVAETATVVASATEQTLCPVMEAPINKDLFVEHEGKKVYFCCGGCEKLFKENPEKYLAKLPQFQK